MKHIYFFIAILFLSCGEEEFEVPKSKVNPIPMGEIISINALVSGLSRIDPEKKITFVEEDQFVEGFVISSDRGGNFFKEIVIQDQSENPTRGIIVRLDERALYQKFPLGSKLRIRLSGLSLGYKNGVVQLGVLKENQIVPIDFPSIENHVFRTREVVQLKPLELDVSQITRAHESVYISLKNIQFDKTLIAPIVKTLAGENSDNFDGLRTMMHCPSGVEIVLCTSTFSSFKNVNLPTTSGKIVGVLGRDFSDNFFVIKINNVEDLDFKSTARCDPVFFECLETDFSASRVLFEENFETITNENKLDVLGWFNGNVTGDEKRWEDRKVTNINNRTLNISAFNTNLRPLEAWLITPEVDLDGTEKAYFKCKIRTRFNNGKNLNMWITNSYSGNPLTTNWELLPVEIPVRSSNFKTIQQSISCISGKIRVAFQYKGFDPVSTSTYEIDNVQFFGE